MKKLFMVLPLVFLLCLTFGCQKAEEVAEKPVVDVEAEKEAVKRFNDEWDAAMNAGDIEKLVSFFTDDGVRIPANGPALIGKGAIRDSFQRQFEQYSVEQKTVVEDIRMSGELGFFRATWTSLVTFKDKGDTRNVNGSFISIVQKQLDGSWKTICNSFSLEQLIFPPPEPEAKK
ncbi:MAG: SgcJ/EcaC family oxidoreductase [Candidatus Aminicenantes bacterium]|jgi:uncharacterized protein (TIGR02246 family)